MALVEGHLLEARTVVLHDVEIERELVLVLVHRRKRTLVFVEQQCLRLGLARRGEDDPPVRKVLGHDVVTDFRSQVVRYNPHQFAGLKGVLPDVPGGRLVIFVDAVDKRRAHGKQQATAVVVDFHIANRAAPLRDLSGDADRIGADSGPLTEEKIGAKIEGDLLAQILLFEVTVVVGRKRSLDVGDREVGNHGICILSRAQLHALTFAAGGNCHAHQRQCDQSAHSSHLRHEG